MMTRMKVGKIMVTSVGTRNVRRGSEAGVKRECESTWCLELGEMVPFSKDLAFYRRRWMIRRVGEKR
jgi:hypothetical protein